MDRRYGLVDLHDVNMVKEVMSRKATAKTTAGFSERLLGA
jgi:hypothetical protein